MGLQSQIESLLFVADKPLSAKKIALLTGASTRDVSHALHSIENDFREKKESGIVCILSEHGAQLTSHSDNALIISEYLSEDLSGELTRPALETLSVISYRGPVTKAAIEEIRGVNCTLALRNLSIRGLIDAQDDPRTGGKTYTVSHEYLRHLGVGKVSDLPNYEGLRASPTEHSLEVTSGLESTS